MAGDNLVASEEAGFFSGFQVTEQGEFPVGEHVLERNPLWTMATDNRENGNNAVKEGKYDQAISRYSELIMQLRSVESSNDVKWNDDSRLKVRQLRAAAYLNLSLCFLKGQQWTHASNTATRALVGDKEPPDARDDVLEPEKKAKALFRRATAQCEFGNFDKARDDLKKAVEYTPNDKGIQQMLQKCDYAVKKVEKKADKKIAGFLNKAVKEGDGGLFDDSLRPSEKLADVHVNKDKPAEKLVKMRDGLWVKPDDLARAWGSQNVAPAPDEEEDDNRPVDYEQLTHEIAQMKHENPQQYYELQEKMKLILDGASTGTEEEMQAKVKDFCKGLTDAAEEATEKEEAPATEKEEVVAQKEKEEETSA